MNLAGERDYSAVRTPVLSFLIQHELFRIDLAEKFPAPASRETVKASRKKQLEDAWREIFEEFGGVGKTNELAAFVERSPMSTRNTLLTLVDRGVVVRLEPTKRSREQTVWKWVG